ncbi:trimeric intracellular cation channel family protein [Catellatospora bangladeshensis]|uniref:Membrane protein n=1 Tax=Catellatospora bangladeshensis TaxID=310355 RepID=A0A8J3NFS4_9ACTN|nr:trimeric intracellular cation channel family protein [Catellatospora bangladeshensis]GIF79632.1 membrane protein [Catellatospora bangladeshensis]
MDSSTALLVGDLAGVAVFAASGGSAAVGKRLDLFGVVFVGFVAALGGGILRDLVINQVPPLAFADWRYPATAVTASLAVFWLHPHLDRLRRTVLSLDAAGLGLFTVTSTLKALDADVPPVGACLLGMLTGIGGGLVRDLLLNEIPVVLRREIYAVASLLGAIAVALLVGTGHANVATLTGAALLVFVVRITALYRHWSAPRPRPGAGATHPGPHPPPPTP